MSRLWPQQGSYWKNRRFVLIIFKSNDYSGIKSVVGPTEGIGRFPVQLCGKNMDQFENGVHLLWSEIPSLIQPERGNILSILFIWGGGWGQRVCPPPRLNYWGASPLLPMPQY